MLDVFGEAGELQAPTAALTDTPPVVPAKLESLDLGPAARSAAA